MQVITRRENHIQQEYEAICKNCGSRLRFKREEVQSSTVTWFGFFESEKRFIQCEVCNNIIDQNQFIPYPPPSGGPTERRKPPPSHDG